MSPELLSLLAAVRAGQVVISLSMYVNGGKIGEPFHELKAMIGDIDVSDGFRRLRAFNYIYVDPYDAKSRTYGARLTKIGNRALDDA